jgi:hypothetical protein
VTERAGWDATKRLIPEKRHAACRHCGKHIVLSPAGWMDLDGFMCCIKGELKVPDYPGQPGGAIRRLPVQHEPMPEGLEGGPS